MKTIAILLFPFLLFAQQNYPDNLVLVNGKSFPCIVTNITDEKIEIIYMNNTPEKTILKAVNLVTVDKLGEVYSTEKGFSYETNYLNDFFEKRIEEFNKQKEIAAELERISTEKAVNEEKSENGEKRICRENETEYIINGKEGINKWSFGVLLIPYYSSRVYLFSNSSLSDPDVYFYTENEINLEGQLAYSLLSEVSLTLDFSYTSTKNETRYEEHLNYNNNQSHSGSIDKYGLSLLDFSLGLKYYFRNIIPRRVTIYAIAGIGKQLAFAENKYEPLYPSPYPITSIVQENDEEYTEDLNSPWHFNLGFGAEYYFNESLSLVSNVRFLYSATSAKYNRYYKTEFETRTTTRERKESYVNTRFGLGLNFYF